MHRLVVVLLAAVDAAIAAAVGLAVLLAPLTLLWTLAFGSGADWGVLWPTTGMLWQFGHGTPIDIALPEDALVAVGLPAEAATFTLSLTPLAFVAFTFFFAARSGSRAARAGAWLSGVLSGSVLFALVAVVVGLTSSASVATTSPLWGILLPAACYAAGALCGAIRHAWQEGDGGIVDRVHDVVDGWGDWGPVTNEAIRGGVVALTVILGVSALVLTAMTVVKGGDVVALFETAHVDALGATTIALGQLLYLPTLLVWTASWLAGPGFAVGTGTAVSPAGTQLGVVPGIPAFGLLPETSSFWMLVVVLVPVAAGAVAGWMVRSRLVWENTARGMGPRAAIAAGIALVAAGVSALAAVLASGSIGPGRLADVGPAPGPLALAVGVEVLIGAAILLLAPRNRDELAEERTDRWVAEMGISPAQADAEATAPLDGLRLDGAAPPPR